MRYNRFISNFDLSQKTLQIFDRDFLHQLKNVLRLNVGQEIILVDGRGQEAAAKIMEYSQDFVAAEILAVKQNQNEPVRRVVLYCAVLKKENFELVAQKATEVGVSEIVPIITEHTVKTGLKYDRLRKIIKEAAEQSDRGIMPVLREAIDFGEAIVSAKINSANLLFDPSGAKFWISDIQNLAPDEHVRVGIFIGSEGGWSEQEMQEAEETGFKIVSLGKLTLRAETAAIVAAYLACHR